MVIGVSVLPNELFQVYSAQKKTRQESVDKSFDQISTYRELEHLGFIYT